MNSDYELQKARSELPDHQLQTATTWIAKVFDECPLGIMQIDRLGQLLYVNPKGLEICGLKSWRDKSLHDLFPDDVTYSLIKDKLAARLQGFSDEYEIELTRSDDSRRIPVSVAAMPVISQEHHVIGGIGIFRSLEIDRAVRAVNRWIYGPYRAMELLEGVAQEVRNIVPYDSLTAAVFSRDMNHARVILQYPRMFLKMPQRWFTIADSMSQWVQEPTRSRKHLAEFYATTKDVTVKSLIDDGFQWMMRCPAHSEGRLVGSIALLTKDPNGFSDRQFEAFSSLPLNTAVLAAIHIESREELEFRFRLVRDISNCEKESDLFELLVDRLATHYGWSHISLFIVDEVERRLVLQSQRAAATNSLPRGYTQSIEQGILGYVTRSSQDICIGDLKTDPQFKDIVLDRGANSASELCLRIIADEKTYALLNVEDSHINAFSKDEAGVLRQVLDDLGAVIDRRRKDIEISASFERTPTSVLFVDANGIIRRVNPSAVKLLDYDSEKELLGTSISKYVYDPTVGTALVKSTSPCGEIELITRSGSVRQVVVGGSIIEAAINRKMITFRDTSVQKKADDFEKLARIYADVAQQTKVPLAITQACLYDLQDLAKTSRVGHLEALLGRRSDFDRVFWDSTQKLIPQLHRIEITYDKLILNSLERLSTRHQSLRLNFKSLIDTTIAALPAVEAAKIRFEFSSKTPFIVGDPYELKFIIETIVAYLARYAALNSMIDLSVTDQDRFVRLSLRGPTLDTDAHDSVSSAAERRFERQLDEMSFGKSVLTAFVANHGGVLHDPVVTQGTVAIHIDFPQSESN